MHFKLLYKKQPLFGLDIGNSNVKLVQVRRAGKKIKLVGYGIAPIPEGSIVEGIITDPEVLADSVKDTIKNKMWGKITARSIAAALPEARVFTRILNLPQIDEHQLKEAIQYETQQYIPMPIDDIYIDYQVIGTEKDQAGKPVKSNVLLVAAPKAIVDSYNKFFETLGVLPKSLEINISAMVRAVVPSVDTNHKGILVADFGSVSTDIAIIRDQLRVTASIPIGGNHLTNLLMKNLKIEQTQAEEIKHRFGLAKSGLQSKISNALNLTLTNIASEMRKMIKFYEERGKVKDSGKVETVIISGGGASLPGLTEYLKTQLNLPVIIGNPWASLTIHPLKPLPKQVAPIYSTAIGLSLRELEHD